MQAMLVKWDLKRNISGLNSLAKSAMILIWILRRLIK